MTTYLGEFHARCWALAIAGHPAKLPREAPVNIRTQPAAAFFLVYLPAISVGNSLGMSTPVTTAVANWFERKRGLAFGIMWSGVGLGSLPVPALGWTIDQFSWRDSAMFVGIGVIVVGMPITAVMRHKPEQHGYQPDGRAPDEHTPGRPSQPDLSK